MTKKKTIGPLLLCALVSSAAAQEFMVLSVPPDEANTLILSTETAGAPAADVPPAPAGAPGSLRIVWPMEGSRLPFVKTSFVYGSADPSGQLTVNGQKTDIHPGGGWLAMVPFKPGAFTVQAELHLGTCTFTASRRTSVASPAAVSPVTPLTLEFVKPEQDLELAAGEDVTVQAKGSPGMKAQFQVEGIKARFPMLEGAEGVYRGGFYIPAGGSLHRARVLVTLTDPKKGKHVTKYSAGHVSRWSREFPLVVEVSTEPAIVRAGPSYNPTDKAGYVLFPPLGIKFEVSGRRGEEWRVKLGPSRVGWISQSDARPLPDGTLPVATAAGGLEVEDTPGGSLVRLALGQKAPFEVIPSVDGSAVDVVFWGVVSNTDWMRYGAAAGGAVEQMRWFQDDANVYRLHVDTRKRSWWGYDARYEGATFVLELRRPVFDALSPLPLAGLLVAVDAGHSADRGAIGPTGTLEKDVNWAMAQCLEKKLREAGAKVEMIRKKDENVPLYARPRLAWQARADLLISVHSNALPDGQNPLEKNGYGVYYFQPLSFDLARHIHAAYGRRVGEKHGLRDDGFHYGNLALPRTTQMPAALTESAYLIVPREEALLKNEDFQCDCAQAMVEGIVKFTEPWKPAAAKPAITVTAEKKPSKTPLKFHTPRFRSRSEKK